MLQLSCGVTPNARAARRATGHQLAKQVPAQYFLLTFTLPAQFRALAWAHQGVLYDLLLRCAWDTVRTFSQNDRQLRGIPGPGAIAVSHTNSRPLGR